jgi:hypothetical protein
MKGPRTVLFVSRMALGLIQQCRNVSVFLLIQMMLENYRTGKGRTQTQTAKTKTIYRSVRHFPQILQFSLLRTFRVSRTSLLCNVSTFQANLHL